MSNKTLLLSSDPFIVNYPTGEKARWFALNVKGFDSRNQFRKLNCHKFSIALGLAYPVKVLTGIQQYKEANSFEERNNLASLLKTIGVMTDDFLFYCT